MKSLVKIATLAIVAMVVAVTGANAAPIRFGVSPEVYPPFYSKDASGKWVGWEMDLMDAVCKAMGEECKIVEIAWDGIIPALQAKQIDVIWASMSITGERQKVIDFTDKYYNTPTAIAGPKDEKFGTAPEDLKGKTIGTQVSTVHQNYVEKYYVPAGAKLKTYQTQDEANQDLAAGRIDATQADAIALDAFLATDQGKACCDMKGNVKEDLEILGPGVGGGVRKEDTALREKLNAAIKKVRESGEYDKITKKYFDFDIYGG
jgi:polar amino acid transport system substrate-binding protein